MSCFYMLASTLGGLGLCLDGGKQRTYKQIYSKHGLNKLIYRHSIICNTEAHTHSL